MTYPRGNGKSEKSLIEFIEWVESLEETPVWASEIEEFCIAVTKMRFPEGETNDT